VRTLSATALMSRLALVQPKGDAMGEIAPQTRGYTKAERAELTHPCLSSLLVYLLAALAFLAPLSHANAERIDQLAIDRMFAAFGKNWEATPDLGSLRGMSGQIHFSLAKNGMITGRPETKVEGGTSASRKIFANALRVALHRTAPFTMLPQKQYKLWSEFTLSARGS
jgi:hypothetical protein